MKKIFVLFLAFILMFILHLDLFAFGFGPTAPVKKQFKEFKKDVDKEKEKEGKTKLQPDDEDEEEDDDDSRPELILLATIGYAGTGNGEFHFEGNGDIPGLYHDGNYLYVCDNGNHRVQRFDSNYNFVDWLGTKDGSSYGYYTSGTPDSAFNVYGAPFVDTEGNVYVQNGLHKIYKFDNNGSTTSIISVDITSFRSFSVDSSSNIFLFTGSDPDTIAKYDQDGAPPLLTFGGFGIADGKFNNSGSRAIIVIDSNNDVFASDIHNKRVQKFDNNGNFILNWDLDYIYSPRCLSIAEDNNIYATEEQDENLLIIYSNTGTFLKSYSADVLPYTDSSCVRNGKIYYLDIVNNKVYVCSFPD